MGVIIFNGGESMSFRKKPDEKLIGFYYVLSQMTESKEEKELFCFMAEQLEEGKIPLPSQ